MRLHTSTRKNFGFALVATVSMMVLLTLVAIAMLSLSTIEQRSSGGSANEADRMARANARMALMIALGELQEAAGPDQRVTATASILGNSEILMRVARLLRMAECTGRVFGIRATTARLIRITRPLCAGWSREARPRWMVSMMRGQPPTMIRLLVTWLFLRW